MSIKTLFIITFLLCVCAVNISAQTVAPTPDRNAPVTTTQGFVDDAAKAFALVVELRDALQKQLEAGGASEVTKAALRMQITELNALIAIKDRKEAAYQSLLDLRDQAFAIYEKVIKMQADMMDKMWKRLNKGQSAFDKFLNGVKQVVTLVTGIIIGKKLGI